MNADLFLLIYACLKAFLPLPSIEAVFVPLCLAAPTKSFYYAAVSGIGTFLGGYIGYELSVSYGRKFALKLVNEETLSEGEATMQKYGAMAVILGSLTPFPDFVLAYLAGLCRMNRWLFLLLDGSCRFMRSLLVAATLSKASEFIAIEKYSTLLSILILVYFLSKYVIRKKT